MEMTITKIARGYIGETEKPKNSGFSNEALESKMKGVGWSPGEPWCSYLAELIFISLVFLAIPATYFVYFYRSNNKRLKKVEKILTSLIKSRGTWKH